MNKTFTKIEITVAKFVLGIATTAVLGWVGWVSLTIIQNANAITSLTGSIADIPEMKKDLSKVKEDVDIQTGIVQALGRRWNIPESIINRTVATSSITSIGNEPSQP